MKNSISYTLAMWAVGLVAVAVAGWGKDLHASPWLQAFSTICLGGLMTHLGITTGASKLAQRRASDAAAASQAAAPPVVLPPVAAPLPQESPAP
jgi:hypothetical protein